MIVATKDYKPDKNYIKIVNNKTYYGTYPFTIELSSILNRANSLGYTIPTFSTLRAMDVHIRNMKTFGVWDKLDVYFEFAYNNTGLANFSLINWKKPESNLAVPSGALNYTTAGWVGNGTSTYLDTNFNPTVGTNNYVLNSACRFFTVSAITGTAVNLDGTIGSVNNAWGSGASQLRINGGGNSPSPLIAGVGFRAIARDSSTACRIHVKNVITPVTATSSSLLNANQLLFRSNTVYSNDSISNYAMSSSLSDTELQNVRTSYNTYLTSVGLTALA